MNLRNKYIHGHFTTLIVDKLCTYTNYKRWSTRIWRVNAICNLSVVRSAMFCLSFQYLTMQNITGSLDGTPKRQYDRKIADLADLADLCLIDLSELNLWGKRLIWLVFLIRLLFRLDIFEWTHVVLISYLILTAYTTYYIYLL